MPKIHILSERLANKIAAGEIVERPASVVKEMVENAIDAGATRIFIDVEDSGRRLIRVSDNGCGLTEKNALLATTGTEEHIPAGLLVGFISEYASTPTDLFYTIRVMPALPLSELSLLSVIVPPYENRD